MASQEFTVLYTHQKMKKSKTWQDGILRIRTGGNKAILFDDKGQCLESLFIKSQVNAGDNLESERYLITVEAVKLNEKSSEDQPRKAETPAVNRNGVKPGGLPPRHLPVGLKRKFTGFQGPRQVEKKISAKEDEEKATLLPLSKQCQSSLPSKFYITSPLFSTVCKKDADTNVSTSFHENVYTNNDKEHVSFTSLVSAPFLETYKETEKSNSDQSIVKPEYPLISEHTKATSRVAVSQNIRSTAQIIALLKSKPAHLCTEQTISEVTECHSKFQTSENIDSFYNQKSTTPPGFSGNPGKGFTQNIQHQHSTKETGSDEREWNAEMLLNSAEQACDKEVAGQRRDRKANILSQDLQDPCNTKTLHPEKMCVCMNLTDSKRQCIWDCERCREPSFSRSDGVPKPLSINKCAASDHPNSCFLSESSISKMSNSQCVPSLSDISYSASPAESIVLETNLSTCRERSVTNGLKEDSSSKSQNELQLRRNSETVSSDLELSADVALTGHVVVKEELSTHGRDSGPEEEVMEVNFNLLEAFDFNDTDNRELCERDVKELGEGDMLSQGPVCLKGKDAAQTVELRLRSCCEVTPHSKKEEVRGLTFDRGNDGNHCPGGVPLPLCDSGIGDIGRTAEDFVSPARIEMELLDDINKIKQINESQLNIEAKTHKKDLNDCAAHTVNDRLSINSQGSDVLPGGTNVNEGHARTSMFEKTESNSRILTSRMISAMDKRTEDDVLQLGCTKSQDIDLEHFQGTSNDDIKPAIKQLTEMPYSGCTEASSCSYVDSSGLTVTYPLCVDNILQKHEASVLPTAPGQGDSRTSDCQPKVISSVQLASSLSPDSPISPTSRNDETLKDIQETVTDRISRGTELSECFFTREESSYPEECNLSRFKPTVKTRTPLVTVPTTEKIPDAEVYLTDGEEVQQSFGSSAVNLCNKSAVFPVSDFGLEDRNYETSVFEDYTADGQRESIQPVFPNVTSQYRQSKWLKYQNSAQCDLITQNSDDVEVTDDIWTENILGMPLGDTGESQSSAMTKSPPGSVPLQTAKSTVGKHCAKSRNRDLISERKLLSLHLSQAPLAEATQKVLSHLSCRTVTGEVQDLTVSELSFPNVDKVKYANLPKRNIAIPTVFQSHVHYKQIFTAALTEHLNIILFELSQRLHKALSKVDISFYTSLKDEQSESKESRVPLCDHMHPAKLVVVKKEGQNKGRLFYSCDAPKAEQCSFFKWLEEVNPGQIKSRPSIVLHDVKSVGAYLRSQKISLYEGCQLLVRKAFEIQTKQLNKLKKFTNAQAKFDGDSKRKLYLKLSRREHSSIYSKVLVHALLVCNASGELTSLRNMEEYFNPSTLPLIPYLLKMNFDSGKAPKKVNKRRFTPPASNLKRTMMYGLVSPEITIGLARKMIQTFSLNPDQATSLIQIAGMMTSPENVKPVEEQQIFPITIIRGVFGAGKSYLLSVVILFLVQLFESSEAKDGPRPIPWKLLIASSTNVAVDRILLGLLDLGFEDFIRVGSVRKIAKPILPYSLHAGSGNENEQLKELLALMKEDLTPAERIYVKKSIEQHKLGTNKAILQQVKVVGVTCAACPFPCMKTLKFPVVVLDECSQMTEPASLLPIARFQCEKLVLVGDPKQLPPTIQGSDSVHEKGLEQTLFDRLSLMGHKAILLRTQYRCHPAISAIANELFYEGSLINGVSEEDRSPLLDWLPTLCFYSVNGIEQIERDNSFYNMAEAHFAVKLIQSLIASGIEGFAIGVITLYKSQMCKIQNLLSGVRSEALEIKAVQVSTVDAFQGAEKEVIVLSCVRTRQVGFIDSEKRMNVALTRAKRHLLIVGNLACLSKNKLWGRVIHHCKGWENGLQHVSQCEQQLNNILKCYLEKKKEEEKDKKKEK
ncbi:5'-3' DNA helicase ZGRF1 isoform X7 [Struthio camelus]|uniref:5'-3' DNA helicase ZGRF1 isoform X7 n=1 Tax=Struthio camelus TaxID=8801 RepID=UPI003604236C